MQTLLQIHEEDLELPFEPPRSHEICVCERFGRVGPETRWKVAPSARDGVKYWSLFGCSDKGRKFEESERRGATRM